MGKTALGLGLVALLGLGGGWHLYKQQLQFQSSNHQVYQQLENKYQALHKSQDLLKAKLAALEGRNSFLGQQVQQHENLLHKAGAQDNDYDFSPAFIQDLPQKIQQIEQSIYYTITLTTFKWNKKDITTHVYGKGTVMNKGALFLTVNHVVSIDDLMVYIPQPPSGELELTPVVGDYQKVSEVTYLFPNRAVFERFRERQRQGQQEAREQGNLFAYNDRKELAELAQQLQKEKKILRLEPLYKKKHTDVAAFKIPSGISLNSFPGEIGDSDRLKFGHYLVILSSPYLAGSYPKDARLSSPTAPAFVRALFGQNPNTAPRLSLGQDPQHNLTADTTLFTYNASAFRGTSGSPVIAFLDGKPHLVGLVQLTWTGGGGTGSMGIGRKISPIKAELRAAKIYLEHKSL